jgi:SWI/SNF-related matrix-associated actin-dependent regulator 1 of chromatin subfamily A
MNTDLDDHFNAAPPRHAPAPTREDILGALKWSAQREVATKLGPRLVSSADANPLVFDLWKRESYDLKSAGYSLGEFRGKWQLSKWEKLPEKVVVTREAAKALSRATDADINVPAPVGCAYLGYQRAGIAFGFERPAVLIGDEMGLGKTIQAIGILNACPDLKRVLVVCPASLKLNWKRELDKWCVRKRAILIADSKTFLPLADGITIINYDVLHKHEAEIRGTEWDALIADEAHYCKNPKARRSQMVFGAKATKKEKENGAADIPGIQARKRILLTGTPIANKPVELFPLINYLDPITWGNFFKFSIRYCAAHQDRFGWDFTGASNLDELQDKLRSTIMVRRLKKDVLTELPPKRRQVVEFPADTPALRAVARAELEAFEGVDDLEADVELAAASDDPNAYEAAVARLKKGQQACFEGLSELRRETAEAKIKLVIAHLRDAVEASGKVVCFAHHKSVVAAIAAEFGDAAVRLVGDTPMQERQDAVDRFQKDPTCSLFIGSIMAAGVGITLTAASHVVFCELDWVPGNVSQAEDRCHRIGQRDSVLVQHLVLESSLDATMARRIIAKQEVIDKALDVVTEKREEGQLPPRRKAPEQASLEEVAGKMTAGQRAAAAQAIVWLRNRCNGARDWDGAGFSKIDVRIGHSLAEQATSVQGLTPKQYALARKVALKYRRQLPSELAEQLAP